MAMEWGPAVEAEFQDGPKGIPRASSAYNYFMKDIMVSPGPASVPWGDEEPRGA